MKLLGRSARFDEPDLDDTGCPACGALAGCCSKYPECPGNPQWKPDDGLNTIRGFLAGAIGGSLLWLAAGLILALGWCAQHAG